jgi:DNA-binding NarL/FixJ family response regulator
MSIISVRTNVAHPYTVVVCGDVLPQPRLLRQFQSAASGITVIQCSEEPGTLALCQRLGAAVLLARQSFIAGLPGSEVAQVANYGSGTHIVAVLENDTVENAVKMLRLGCRGTIPARFSVKLLKDAVASVLNGEMSAPARAVATLLSDLLRTSARKQQGSLTPQEERILDLTAQGLKNSAIAEALFISPATVRWHKRRLYRKIGGRSRKSSEKAVVHNPESAAG